MNKLRKHYKETTTFNKTTTFDKSLELSAKERKIDHLIFHFSQNGFDVRGCVCRCDGASRCVKLDWPLAQSNFIHLDAAIPPKEYVFHANSPETITRPVAVSHLPPPRQRYCVKPPNDAHPNQLRVEEKFETPTFEPTVNGPCAMGIIDGDNHSFRSTAESSSRY